MHIKTFVMASSEQRFKKADFSPAELDKKLGDGHPLDMSGVKLQVRRRQLLAQNNGDPMRAQVGLERIINGNDLDSVNYLLKGVRASHAVCRIQLNDANSNLVGYASGFLIGPSVLLTNHHVFGDAQDAANSIADFDYELDIDGQERQTAHFGFEPAKLFYTNDKLDYSVVAVAPLSRNGGRSLSDWGWLPLNGDPGKGDPGEYLTIIQHPGGQTKQICVRENKLLKYFGDFVWYMTDTTSGSSGSPAFNRFWQVIALHHSGVPKKNAKGEILCVDGTVWNQMTDESLIDWIANEGARVSSIVADLKASMGSHPLVKAALEVGQFTQATTESSAMAPIAGKNERADLWIEDDGETASLVVPLRIPIELRRLGAISSKANVSPVEKGKSDAIPAPALNPLSVEAVIIDQTTLGSRPGYRPNFLGSGKFSVPLPKIPASLKSKVATLKGKAAQSELKYFNYSVVMNKARKLAFFSVVNIDGSKQQDVGKRMGDTWYIDPRIDAAFQIGNEFYGRQSTFEADRTANPFDRGHLVRRLDATWGGSVDEAKEHGNDSFHFTNCSPQFWSFNQGKRLWAGLEDYTRDTLLRNREKGVVMNGPIFDGPDAEGDQPPDPNAPAHADPKFGGLPIPKYFWKILITKEEDGLKILAFIMSQRNLVLNIDRIEEKFTDEDVKVFQVSVADISKLTKLDFGSLMDADTEEAAMVGARRIESFSDIRI